MSHRDGNAEFIRQTLQTYFPSPGAVAVGTTAIRLQQPAPCLGIAPPAILQPPGPQRCRSKVRCFMRSTHDHKAGVAPQIVPAIGNRSAFGGTGKVVIQYRVCLLPPAAAGILEVAHQFLFLGIHADDGPSLSLEPPTPA